MNERLKGLKREVFEDLLHLLEAVQNGELQSSLPGAQEYVSGKHLHLCSDFKLLKVLPRNVNSVVRNLFHLLREAVKTKQRRWIPRSIFPRFPRRRLSEST